MARIKAPSAMFSVEPGVGIDDGEGVTEGVGVGVGVGLGDGLGVGVGLEVGVGVVVGDELGDILGEEVTTEESARHLLNKSISALVPFGIVLLFCKTHALYHGVVQTYQSDLLLFDPGVESGTIVSCSSQPYFTSPSLNVISQFAD